VDRRGVSGVDLAVGLAVTAIGLLVFFQTRAIPVSPIYAQVGPTVMPYAVAAGLLALGIALSVDALRGGWSHESEEEALPIDWRALFWLGLGLLLNVVLIDALGFVVASTLMFVCIARAFGSTALIRDAGIAVAVSLAAYLGFDKLLGINIGAGILEGIL